MSSRNNINGKLNLPSLNLPKLEHIIDYHPLTVTPDTDVRDGITLMNCPLAMTNSSGCVAVEGEQSSCILVVEESQLIGIFTDQHIVKLAANQVEFSGLKIADMMSTDVITITNTKVKDIFTPLLLLRQHQMSHLPVVDDRGKLIGLVTDKTIYNVFLSANLLKSASLTGVMTKQFVLAPTRISILRLVQLMVEYDVNCGILVEQQPDNLSIPVGIITEGDIRQFQILGIDFGQTPAESVMSTPLFSLSPSDSLWYAHEQMQRHHVHRLVVVGKQGELLGIVTQSNFLQALDPVEMSGLIVALQQKIEEQGLQLKEANQRLQQEVALRQQAEAALHQANEELETTVTQGSAELDRRMQQNSRYVNTSLQEEISKRQGLEAEYYKSEEKLRYLTENLQAVIWIGEVDSQNNLYVSPAYEEIWGRSCQSLLQQPTSWLDAVHPQDREYVNLQMQEQLRGRRIDMEYRILRPDGSLRWIWNRGFAIPNPQGDVELIGGIAEDITERKLAESALRESEERFRQLAENIQDVFWISEPENRKLIYVSPTYEKVWGRSCEAVYADYMQWLNAIHPDDFQRVQTAVFESLPRGDYDQQYRIIRPDGSVRWIRDRGFAISNQEGECQRFAGVAEDITDSKLVETALQQQIQRERLLADIARNIRKSLNLVDVLNTTVQQVRQFLGTDRVFILRFESDGRGTVVVESVGTGWTSLLSTTIYDQSLSEIYVAPHQHGEIAFNENIYTAELNPDYVELLTHFQVKANLTVPIFQGEGIWGLLIAHHCCDTRQWHREEIELLQGLATHVSIAIQQSELYQQTHSELIERSKAELALKESEVRFRVLSEASPIGICQTDAQGRCIYANARCLEITGLTWAEILGDGWRQAIHPGDRATVTAQWDTCVLAGRDYLGEFRVLTPQRKVRWVYTQAATLYSETGEFLGLVCTYEDITERKRVEKKLQSQLKRERLVANITQRIRQSLNLEEVLNTTVEEVRQFLLADRVFIYKFEGDFSGQVLVESVVEGWLSTSGVQIWDSYFMETQGEEYRQGRIQAIADIYTAKLSECHFDLLLQFQVRAHLVVPILQGEKLWGLLVANQCSAPRRWQRTEIDLLKQLSAQVGIAIQQSELYQHLQAELIERKQAEEALRESEERYRSVIAIMQEGIVLHDADGSISACNASAERILGISVDEILGRKSVDQRWRAIHEDGSPFCGESHPAMITLRTGKPCSGVIMGIHKPNGELTWILVNSQPLLSEGSTTVHGVVCSFSDISEHKFAEEKIREQAALLDVTTDAIFVRDLQQQILFWNKGSQRVYGFCAAEALGKDANQLLSRNISPQLTQAIKTVVEKGAWQGELQKITKSGKEITVECRWSLIRDEAGKPKSILTVDTDITEKKQLEQQFLRAQRLESLGNLASGIAHDLNNILTPILSSAQLLSLKLDNIDERNQQLLKIIEDNSKRGADLVKQILTFARGAEGRRIPLQLAHLLTEIEQIVNRTFPKSIHLTKDIPTGTLWTVLADPTQIHQVLMNLCVNARDAIVGGGNIHVSGENLYVDENFAKMNLEAKEGPYVLITVTDNGLGIPTYLLDRIFEPFFTTKEPGKGTGLGLSTAIGIVKNHGGFVKVSSEVGKGSQFQIYLPAMAGSATQQMEDLQLVSGNGELILVADDEASIQEITTSSLEDYNYKTLSANDGIEAIALYAEHKNNISLVIMDMIMPFMDGLTAIRTMEKMNPEVKIIAVSGLASNMGLAENAGVKAFLNKPYTVKELLMTIHQVLRE
ncbi:MAG: PAS domain S-box protein [Nostocaceae cyanobacterium]|nr:PAS domain S-box protein [Nostocaceae cyanobacterium]